MKYVFVGDIHGKVEQVERALEKEGKKIFVGDFMDSFTRPNEDHRKCLTMILDAAEKDEAGVIYGNHELSYLNPHHKCSGWSIPGHTLMLELRGRIEKIFKPHILLFPEFLVTHAGLTKQIWDEFQLTHDNLEQKLSEWWLDNRTPVHWIGNYRGGFNDCGGTFWCDFNKEFRPIKGITQVFGHTSVKGIRQVKNSFCIDCLDNEPSFLEMDL